MGKAKEVFFLSLEAEQDAAQEERQELERQLQHAHDLIRQSPFSPANLAGVTSSEEGGGQVMQRQRKRAQRCAALPPPPVNAGRPSQVSSVCLCVCVCVSVFRFRMYDVHVCQCSM